MFLVNPLACNIDYFMAVICGKKKISFDSNLNSFMEKMFL